MKNLLVLVLVLIYCSANGQNEKESREPFVLEIAANEENQYQLEVESGKYFVKDKMLQIYCTEKLFIECEIMDNEIVSMKVVRENNNPNKTIEIDFSQNSEDRKNIKTTLIVKNPFDKKLHYDAEMFTPISQQWKTTSIIPISPKLQNFEFWSHSIITLVLHNWRLL